MLRYLNRFSLLNCQKHNSSECVRPTQNTSEELDDIQRNFALFAILEWSTAVFLNQCAMVFWCAISGSKIVPWLFKKFVKQNKYFKNIPRLVEHQISAWISFFVFDFNIVDVAGYILSCVGGIKEWSTPYRGNWIWIGIHQVYFSFFFKFGAD